MKSQVILASGIEKAQTHLVGYNFPADFIEDITPLIRTRLFPALAGVADELLLPSIARLYGEKKDGYDVTYNTPKISKVIPTRVHLQYGPSPVGFGIPEGYTMQEWGGFKTLVISDNDAIFENYFRQKEVEQSAIDEGIFIRIDTRVIFSEAVEFCITDTKRGLV